MTVEPIVPKPPWQRLAAIVTAAAVLLGLIILLASAPPPIEGYHGSKGITTLDGSSGYLHIYKGIIDVISVGGSGGDSMERRVATYETHSRSTIHIVFKYPDIPAQTVSIGKFSFHWSTDFTNGNPYDNNRCYRELRPWRIRKLSKLR